MKKVAVYPFDKITRGLVKFRDMVEFQICSVIDFIYNIGEDAGTIVCGSPAGIPILDDAAKALEGLDTLIVNSLSGPSYLEKYMKIYREHDVDRRCREMLKTARDMGIEIVCIHDMVEENLQMWLRENQIMLTTFSKSSEQMKSFIEEGKQLALEKKSERISIYATRGCLGKYTAQMYLMRAMRKKEKKAAALVTEPVGMFYGQYDADPIRFGMLKDPLLYVYYIESLAKHAEADGNKYLIMADQQSITSHNFIEEMASKISILKAYHPDKILLIAGYDDNQKIRDCMDIFRIYCGKKPVAILIPDCMEVTYGIYEKKTREEVEARKQEIRQMFEIEQVELVCEAEKLLPLLEEKEN